MTSPAVLRDGHRLSVRTIALGVVPLAATAVTAGSARFPWRDSRSPTGCGRMLSLATDALAVPAQVFVSGALGRGDWAAAKRAARRTLVLGLAFGCGLGLVTAALALFAPAVFTADPTVRHAAVVGLLWSALTQPLAALAFVYDGVILGLGDYTRHAPRDAPRDPRLRAAGRPGAPLPLARPARRVDRARLLARRQGRAALAALG